jgi:hypothetical protein
MRCTQVSKYNTPDGSAQPHVARGEPGIQSHGGGVQSSVVADESHRTDADVLRNASAEGVSCGGGPAGGGVGGDEVRGCWMVDFSSLELFMMFTRVKSASWSQPWLLASRIPDTIRL